MTAWLCASSVRVVRAGIGTDARLTVSAEGLIRQVYDAVGCGIIVRDGTGTLVHANDAALRMFGAARDQVVGRQLLGGVARFREDGTPISREDLVSVRALREKRAIRGDLTRLVRADGREIVWSIERALEGQDVHTKVTLSGASFDVDYSPLRDAKGDIYSVVGLAVDVTERARAERRLSTIHAVTRVIAGATRHREVREQILRTLGQSFGWDYAAFWRVDT